MNSEEQLRELYREEYRNEDYHCGGCMECEACLFEEKRFVAYGQTLLHQAELNWVTEQIERGERMRKTLQMNPEKAPSPAYKRIAEDGNKWSDGYNTALTDFLAPLIERKKELESLLAPSPEQT